MNAPTLHSNIRWRIAAGRLPLMRPDHTALGGQGEGAPCDCCGQPIRSDEIQYEIQWQVGPASNVQGKPGTVRMHLKCYEVWSAVSRASVSVAEPPGPPRPVRS